MIISGFKQNIYFIDLIDFSSKQHKSIQDMLGTQKSTGFHMNRGYKYVLVNSREMAHKARKFFRPFFGQSHPSDPDFHGKPWLVL